MDSLMRRRNEIGSEFWSIPLSNKTDKCVFQGVTWFMSGRSALECIISDIKKKHEVRTALLPSWCCDSMIVPFLKAGIQVQFYPVFVHDGLLRQDIGAAQQCDIVFLMDYFGYNAAPVRYCGNAVVIRDVTHSIFSNTYTDADYYFGSLRKWCGFKTGGFAFGINGDRLMPDDGYISLRRAAMEAKEAYIVGNSDSKAYLEMFSQAEEYLEHCTVAGADPEEIVLAPMLDIGTVKARRRENAAVLIEGLADICLFPSMEAGDCPMFVPVIVPDGQRDALRRYLIEQQIYCPVHWPISKYHSLDEKTGYIYGNELSLVCDQRYTGEDMERIVEAVWRFLKR